MVAALVASGSVDALAGAALFARLGHSGASPDQSVKLIRRAALSAPDRADIAWLREQLCRAADSCDPGPMEQRLRALDPDNGAGWIYSLSRASRIGDTDSIEADVRAIAGSKRFDVYWTSITAHVTNAIVRTRTWDLPSALDGIGGMLAAIDIPPFGGLVTACRGDALQIEDRQLHCRDVASVMRRGDTYIVEMVGIGIAMRVWPEDSPEYVDAVEARRVARYRMLLNEKLREEGGWNEAHALQFMDMLARHRREQEVSVDLITAAGQDPKPPVDWTEPEPMGPGR